MRTDYLQPGILLFSLLMGGAFTPSHAAPAAVAAKGLSPEVGAATSAISARSLQGHVSFLASDLLEGRGTPSRGLEIAGEYLAAQFRRAGLKPVGDEGYFQNAGPEDAALRKALGDRPFRLRNVAGLLEGSDPKLKDTYIIVSAHYDHLGVREGPGDTLYNGANDNASGTASLIELASALSALKTRPRRSLLFLAFFGEERGMLGSRYYARRPLVPLEKTVAQVNLEQLGRTDDREGARVASANLTGFDYTTMGDVFTRAGMLTGVKVFKHPVASDAYYPLSDNIALAERGIPSHTLSVAYSYSDYHEAGDHWEKIDYENLKKINGMIAAGLLMIANDPLAPRWLKDNPKALPYASIRDQRRRE